MILREKMTYLNIAAQEDDCEYLAHNFESLQKTPEVFFSACEMDSKNCVKFLIHEYGALKDKNACYQAFSILITKNNVTLAKYLFEHGATVEFDDGKSLMYKACLENNEKMVSLFLDNNILPNEKCYKILITQGFNSLFKFLFKKSNVVPLQCIYMSYVMEEYDILFFLYDHGVKYNSEKLSYAVCFKKEIDDKIQLYDKIVKRTKDRAARKIYFWWIPICYDLNRQCGKNMMNKILNRIENYEKPIL